MFLQAQQLEGMTTLLQENSADTAREVELILRVKSGEPDVFYQLIQPYEKRVFATAMAILRNEADAEDVAQESILKALRHISQFRGEAKFSTWLLQITVNEARMRKRRMTTRAMEPIGEPPDDESEYRPREFADWREIPSESLERKEVRNALIEALNTLGEKYRSVFVMRDIQHMSIEETAKVLEISQASVKTRLFRARLILRDLLSPGLNGQWTSKLAFAKGVKPWE